MKIDEISLEDEHTIHDAAAACGLPHLREFLAEIADRQNVETEKHGRAYQHEIIRSGRLKLVSPFSGSDVAARQSLEVIRGSIAFRFVEDQTYYVLSSQIRAGYPLGALYLPESNRLLKWDGEGGIQRRHGRMLRKLHSRAERAALPQGGVVPTVVIGHRNFAHHMWNELSALEYLLKTMPEKPALRLLVARETLGPLTDIFPEIGNWTIERSRVAERRQKNSEMLVNLAGYRLSPTLKSRLVAYAGATATDEMKSLVGRIRKLGAPTFWLSVRTQAPTFSNQKEVLAAIAGRLLERNAPCCIVFDGFSLPQDWKATSEKMCTTLRSLAQDSCREIAEIIREVTESRAVREDQFLLNAGGIPILDSIALAQLVDGYFCHVGTYQHKVGWTTCAPGVIHGNRYILATDPAMRHANRADEAVAPAMIDERWIADEPDGGKNANYRATDVAALADFVADFLRDCAAARARGTPEAVQGPPNESGIERATA